MPNNIINLADQQPAATASAQLFEDWFDPIEAALEPLYILGKEGLCTGEAILMLFTIRLDGESLHAFLNAVTAALPTVMRTATDRDFHADNQGLRPQYCEADPRTAALSLEEHHGQR